MRTFGVLVRRELGAYFLSLTGYVIIAAVLLLLGVSFSVILMAYNGVELNVPITELFYSTMFFWLILLVLTPVVTMRLYAHERFSGTFETLMTTPVSDLEVVLAKFTASMVFYAVAWLPMLACVTILRSYTGEGAMVDGGALGGTFFGILLIGGLYLSMGGFASSLSRSQLIGAIMAFAFGVSLFLVSFLKFSMDSQPAGVVSFFEYISLFNHMEDFVRGVVDTRHVVFHTSLTVMFLFLTLKVVESRRWK